MNNWTRREFLAASALAAAAQDAPKKPDTPGRDRPAEAPSGRVSPNDRIVLGFIGTGGMGTGLINIFKGFPQVRIASVCDVYEPHLLRAKSQAGGKPDTYGDFRRVLDRRDIDAVVIAAPDHWHAIIAILACQAGKDVYCEKPLGHRIHETRAMVTASEKAGRVTQMGNLMHATENYHRVVEIVRSGVLGTISKARVWMAGARGIGRPADGPPPPGCDYDFWLGPAPRRPFNPNRFTFNWRYFWDYGGGILMDFCCHIVDLVHWAMDVEAPRTISAVGGRYALDDNAEVPDTLEVAYEYQKGDRTFLMAWSHTDANAHGLENQPLGIMFQGTNATLVANYNHYRIIPEKGREKIDEPPKTLPRSVGHHREWLDAIRSRSRCSCHFGYGHQLTTVGQLGNISLWSGEKLRWDPVSERITSHEAANQYLTKEYRKPWTLPTV